MSRRFLQDSTFTSPPSSSSDVSPSIMITVLILAIAVILSASLYLLLRFLSRNRHHHTTTTSTNTTTTTVSPPSLRQVTPVERNPVLDTLPVFSFDSLSSKNAAHISGDCAVCLSKFERRDLLRLLPICCHAFHADCIDTWLSANMTCPLCRSPIFLSDADLLTKLSADDNLAVEIGNISDRRTAASNTTSGEIHRSYSLGGSFDYIVADVDTSALPHVPTGSFRMTSSEFNKLMTSGEQQQLYQQQQSVLAGEVSRGGGGGGGWLKDYLSNSISSSRSASFRGSGRWFFTGSSRRSNNSNIELPHNNELGELGDEIGELFRWLSGV